MKWWQSVMLAMLVWGNAALANTTADVQSSVQQLQTIQKGVAHFNLNYPTLNVKIKALSEALQTPQSRQSLIDQLQALDDYMHGDYVLPVGSLKDIACGRPVCDGGGGGGKCHMCAVDDSQEHTPL